MNAQQLDHRVPLGETLGLQRNQHCRLVGQTSALDATLLGLSGFGTRNEATLGFGKVRKVADNDYFVMHSDTAFPTYEEEVQCLMAVEQTVAPYGPALIDIYFRNVHPSFPIIQKHTFLDRHRNGDREFHSALLAGMYLLALRWWSQDPVLAQHPIPSVYRLEEIAARSLALSMQKPKLSALQAGLLLLQRRQATDWGLTVQLVALAQDLGLHLDCSEWSIPLWERRLRKRLAWALYMQDKWTALVHGRPSHIQAADWAVGPLAQGDFNEDFETADQDVIPEEEDEEEEQSRVIFTQMIELTGIMAEVIDVFYTQRAIAEVNRAGKNGTRLILGKAKPVQLKLKEWFGRLPTVARMDTYTAGKLSSNGKSSTLCFFFDIQYAKRPARLPPSCIFRNRDINPSPDCAIFGPRDCRSLYALHLSVSSKDQADLCYGLCESVEARTSRIVLVLRLGDQLRPHQHIWQSASCDCAGTRGVRLLSEQTAGIQVGAQRQLPQSRVARTRCQNARCNQ